MRHPCRGAVTVTSGFLLAAAAMLYLDSAVALPSAAAAALHELGHWGAIHALGGRVSGFTLSVAGAEMRLDGARALSYPGELAAALAGPAVSLLCAWGAAKLGFFLFAGLSLALGLFNLLPVVQLDGGRIVYALIAWLLSEQHAARVVLVLSVITAGCLLGLGATLFKLSGNFTLLVTAIWLVSGLMKQK